MNFHSDLSLDACASAPAERETSFAEVLLASPQLLSACVPGWGRSIRNSEACEYHNRLRILRLVSKAVGKAALREVESFSLYLGNDLWTRQNSRDDSDVDGVVGLLRCSKLRCLYVNLEGDNKEGVYRRTPQGWSQLQSFISGMGQALSSVTQLFITTWLYKDITSASTNHQLMRLITVASSALAALATACPALTSLHLDGEIGFEALSAFGTSCPHMTNIFLTAPSIPCIILHHLHNLFPALAGFSVKDYDAAVDCDGHKATVETYCSDAAHALSSCTNLASLDLPSLHITSASTWAYLPSSLLDLTIGSCCIAPPTGIRFPFLSRFTTRKTVPRPIPGSPLTSTVSMFAGIAQALPQLKAIEGKESVFSICAADERDGIISLHDRIKTGLRMQLSICHEVQSDDSIFCAFLTPLPPLPLYTSLTFLARLSKPDVGELVRVFPNITHLSLICPVLGDNALGRLLGLKGLHTLEIVGCDNITDVEVVILSSRLPLLRRLKLVSCAVSESKVLQSLVRQDLMVEVWRPAVGGAVRS